MAYSEEELIEELERVSEEYCGGEAPRIKDMKKHGDISPNTYRTRFNSWKKAVEKAGIIDFYAEDFVEDIQNVSEEYCNGDAPTWRDMQEYACRDPETYTNRHDCTWNDLLEEAGFEHNRADRENIKTWEKAKFLDAVEEYCADLNCVPFKKEAKKDFVTFPAHKQRWGLSWEDIITEVADFSLEEIKSSYPKYERDELDEALKSFDEAPTMEEFKEETGISMAPIKRIYGSWREYLLENGFVPNNIYKDDISEEELIEKVLDMSEENLPPTLSEFTNESKYTQHHIEYIGGWKTLLNKSGFEYNARYSGQNHHQWKGGKKWYYGPHWSKNRRKVIERDGGECRLCGKTEDIHVHHITPARLFGEDYQSMNEENNLVCLCRDCHNRWEGRFIDCEHDEFVEKCLQAKKRSDEMSLFQY